MLPEDKRDPLLNLLAVYRTSNLEESSLIDRFQGFVENHLDCFERSLIIGHVTGSALILDNPGKRVLLTHHKKLERWLQPGGHADGDDDVKRVAMKEAREESGLEKLEFHQFELLDVDIHTIPARMDEPEHEHYDCRFLLQSTGSDEFVVSSESIDLSWVHMDKIADYTVEESILRMIRKAKRILAAKRVH